ncbi:MAG TPA: globin domain-containing protein [Vicinamibacterales bacterium]|nr:globin domain-containing protein [Vicinamibacterales bacterium]
MTATSVANVQEHFDRLTQRPGLATTFYRILFATAPELRPLFPNDLYALSTHFESMLKQAIENLGRMTAMDSALRELGIRHMRYGAQPHHYPVVLDVLLQALKEHSGEDWNDALATDWRLAILAIVVPMLRGAAVETAELAQRLASEDSVDIRSNF